MTRLLCLPLSLITLLLVVALAVAPLLTTTNLAAAEAPKIPSAVGADAAAYERTVARAVRYLREKGQAPDGSFSGVAGPGVTALVTSGLLQNGRSPNDPMVAKALKYIEKFVQPDGGIYKRGALYRNYDTCLSMVCFSQANRGGRYNKIIKRAEQFVRKIQWDKGEGLEDSDRRLGGAGYGKHKRPDLSNTTFFIEALRSAGADKNDPAIQAALKFVGQCQNFESEHNTGKHAAKNPDGGFIYTPDESQAGDTPNGGLRSYASMTYAGLKSMIYAGVDEKDPRVKAAFTWIQKNYGLDNNPGLGNAGLFYYYHTFAKALDALGKDVIVDAQGKSHDWRRELFAELARRQRKDGSWINTKSDRWMEGSPNLVTGYALMALSYCKPKAGK